MRCFKMFHKAMLLTRIVHESDVTKYLQNGWVVLFECSLSGEFIRFDFTYD